MLCWQPEGSDDSVLTSRGSQGSVWRGRREGRRSLMTPWHPKCCHRGKCRGDRTLEEQHAHQTGLLTRLTNELPVVLKAEGGWLRRERLGRYGACEAETVASVKVRREVRRTVGEAGITKAWGEWDAGRTAMRSHPRGLWGQTEQGPY